MSEENKIGDISITCRKAALEWKINNFFSHTEEGSKYFSSDFHALNLIWKIELRPNGESVKNSTGFVSMYLYRVDDGASKPVSFSFGIKTKDNLIVNKKKTAWESDRFGWGWPMFIERSKLQQGKPILVPSGNLIICCKIVKDDEPELDIKESMDRLAADFKDMFISKKNTDVTIKVKDQTFSAHRFILVARSPVLAAMFENEMTEKKTGFVDIHDCDPEAFNHFLLYLYSGELEFGKCNLFHLYQIGDKYDVPQIKSMCVNCLIRTLSLENFCEIYLFAEQFYEEKLLTVAQNFFIANFEKVVSLDSWVSMMEEETFLTNNLLKAIAPKVKIEK